MRVGLSGTMGRGGGGDGGGGGGGGLTGAVHRCSLCWECVRLPAARCFLTQQMAATGHS